MFKKLIIFILFIFNSLIFSSESSSSSSASLFSEKEQKIINEVRKLIEEESPYYDKKYAPEGEYTDINKLLLHVITSLDPLPYKKDNQIKALKLLLDNFKDRIDLNKVSFVNERRNLFPLEFPRNDNDDVRNLLIDYGANINQQDEKGNSLLLRALILLEEESISRLDFVKFLLRAGADPNIANNDKESFSSKLKKGPILKESSIPLAEISNEYLKEKFDNIQKIFDQVKKERKLRKEKIMTESPLPAEMVNIILDLAPDVPASTSSSSSSTSSVT